MKNKCCEKCYQEVEMSMTTTTNPSEYKYKTVQCSDRFCPNCHWTPIANLPEPIEEKVCSEGYEHCLVDHSTPSSNSKVEEWEDRIQMFRGTGIEITPAIKKIIEKERMFARQEERERVTHYYKVKKTGKLGREDMDKAFEAGRKKELTGIVEYLEKEKRTDGLRDSQYMYIYNQALSDIQVYIKSLIGEKE